MTKAQIIGKILITGELVLKSPLLIGDGSGETSENSKDVHTLKNRQGTPFIPGTSICGVLREDFKNNTVLENFFGNEDKLQSSIQIEDVELFEKIKFRCKLKNSAATESFYENLREKLSNAETLKKLFRNAKTLKDSIQIEDAEERGTFDIFINLRDCLCYKKISAAVEEILGEIESTEFIGGKIIFRDGVKIDGVTGTGVKGAKYDYEAVERGARGDFRLLINLRGFHIDEQHFTLQQIKSAVAEISGKLTSGIQIGALTAKGFGVAAVENLDAQFYDFTKKADIKAWFTDAPAAEKIQPAEKIPVDEKTFIVDAHFDFNSSFIVRNYDVESKDADENISAVTLKSLENFVIPGTTLKGILRHRAEYIFRKLKLDAKFLNNLMGNSEGDSKIKSRFKVSESYIENKNVVEISHARNKIDRFTGGTLLGALFTTKPVYQKVAEVPTLHVHFEIIDAKDFETGLAIFLLRDLWLGNVAVGGDKGIGRGTLKGVSAEINFNGKIYKLDENGKVIEGNKDELSKFAASVKDWREN